MNYLFLILLAACVLLHIFMMFKGHSGHDNDNTENKKNNASTEPSETKEEDNKHKHSGCCH